MAFVAANRQLIVRKEYRDHRDYSCVTLENSVFDEGKISLREETVSVLAPIPLCESDDTRGPVWG